MARDYYVNGPTLVQVKGKTGSSIATLQELGTCESPIRISLQLYNLDIRVNAFGDIPPEVQFMGGIATISMSLVNFDKAILDECLRLSMGGATTIGTMPTTGARMRGTGARFASDYNFIGLNMTSPVEGKPYRFLNSQLFGSPFEHPLGAERSVTAISWRALALAIDPYGAGSGFGGTVLFDNVLDS